jgi:hypothetical protein
LQSPQSFAPNSLLLNNKRSTWKREPFDRCTNIEDANVQSGLTRPS